MAQNSWSPRSRTRACDADLRHSGRGEPRRRRSAAPLDDRAGADPPRAGGGLHGGDARAADRQARRLHHDARPRRAQSHDRRGLRAARRHADGDDHRAEGHPEPQAGGLSDRRHRRDDDAADQDGATRSSAPRPFRPWCARRSASRSRSGRARCISNCRRTSPRETAPDMAPVPPHPIEAPVAPGAALDRAAELILRRRTPADHAGRGGEPAAACRRAVRVRAAGADSVLQHADGQGRRHRRVRSSIWAPRRCRSATTCIGRSTAPISSSRSATTRSRSRRS